MGDGGRRDGPRAVLPADQRAVRGHRIAAVVPIEQTDGGVSVVEFESPPREGAHIRLQGEIVRTGEPLLTTGHLLTPGAQSLLATHGHELGSPAVGGFPADQPPEQQPAHQNSYEVSVYNETLEKVSTSSINSDSNACPAS